MPLKILSTAFSPFTKTLAIKWILASMNFSIVIFVCEILLYNRDYNNAINKSLYYYELEMREKFENIIKKTLDIFN